MIDRPLALLIKPYIDAIARRVSQHGLQADTLTWIGFFLGLTCSCLIANGYFLSGLALLLISRVFDALDGAVARLTTPTDRGGFLDITLDFIFYASVPLAFAFANPAAHALAATTLLFAFMGTSSSFLAYASLAAKRASSDKDFAPSPHKSIHYLGGLTEGFETLLCFSLMCLMPQHFSWFAYGFAFLCGITTITRIYFGWTASKP